MEFDDGDINLDELEGLIEAAQEREKETYENDAHDDVNLDELEGLIEAAQEREKTATEDRSHQSNFTSILESLDEIPVKAPLPKASFKVLGSAGGKGKIGLNEEKSIVHSGDTDSEDDEDKKYFHKKQYNEYGSSIKRMLESQETSPSFGFQGSSGRNNNSWKNSPKVAPGTLCVPSSEVKTPRTDLNVDTLLGVRVVNPVVSSTVLSERLTGRKVVPFSTVKTFTSNGKIQEDWVIVGVIVSKSPPRTSAKGSTYSIVRLSDLRGAGDMKTVSVFLFSTACKIHGKNTVGSVLGILNPGVLDNSKGNGDEACLSVDGADRIMLLGVSKDFALCKSKKKNGENCTSFVNKASCEYCIYHVKQEYKQFARRTELQASYTGKGLPGGLSGLRNKVLGKSEVFYGGQSFTAIPAKKSNKIASLDNHRLSVLSGMKSATEKRQVSSKGRLATSVELSHRQAQKDLDRLRKLDALGLKSSAEPGINASAQSFSPALDVSQTRNETAFISKAREIAASKPALSSPQPSVSDLESNKATSKSLPAASPVNQQKSKAQNLTSGTPKTSSQISRGATFALAATQRNTSSPKCQPSAFGLGSKSGLAAEDVSTVSPLRKAKEVQSGSSCGLPSSPLTAKENKRVLGTKNVSALIDESVALQKSPAELKILTHLLEKRATKVALPKVAQEETSSVITKASDFGLGRGSRMKPKADSGRVTPISTKSVPTLSAGVSNSGMIEFDLSLNSKNIQIPKPTPTGPVSGGGLTIHLKNSQSSKLKALEYIRRNGSIAKEDPNKLELSSKKKAAPANTPQEQKKKKRKIELLQETTGTSKKKISADEEKHKEKMAEFKALMEVSSKHADLVTKADNDAQDEYFNNLEKKEKLEEKMLNTFKVPCKAVTCSSCKYTAFSAADICKEERHPLKVHDAMKRFFKCADCGNRTCCLEIIPLKTCSNCNSSRWERTAMIRERKVGVGSETLSIRGGEEKFIGSVVTGANLNLLVPD